MKCWKINIFYFFQKSVSIQVWTDNGPIIEFLAKIQNWQQNWTNLNCQISPRTAQITNPVHSAKRIPLSRCAFCLTILLLLRYRSSFSAFTDRIRPKERYFLRLEKHRFFSTFFLGTNPNFGWSVIGGGRLTYLAWRESRICRQENVGNGSHVTWRETNLPARKWR